VELDRRIAEITIESKTKQVVNVNFRGNPLRFRCQRCAVFCCKLGGPRLTARDVERLSQAGYDSDIFLDDRQTSLKSGKDGSCIFLSFNAKEGLYQCSVYDYRPTFCRLYPFQLEKSGLRTCALKFIPCCNGLNTEDGEGVNEKFFGKFLQKILLDLMDSDAI